MRNEEKQRKANEKQVMNGSKKLMVRSDKPEPLRSSR